MKPLLDQIVSVATAAIRGDPLAVGGVAAAAVLLFVCLIYVFAIRKRRRTKPKKKSKSAASGGVVTAGQSQSGKQRKDTRPTDAANVGKKKQPVVNGHAGFVDGAKSKKDKRHAEGGAKGVAAATSTASKKKNKEVAKGGTASGGGSEKKAHVQPQPVKVKKQSQRAENVSTAGDIDGGKWQKVLSKNDKRNLKNAGRWQY